MGRKEEALIEFKGGIIGDELAIIMSVSRPMVVLSIEEARNLAETLTNCINIVVTEHKRLESEKRKKE